MKEKSIAKKFKEEGAFNPIIKSLIRIVGWFGGIGISYLIQLLGWMEMPKAYLLLNIILSLFIMVLYLLGKGPIKARIFAFFIECIYLAMLIIVPWIVSIVLGLNFFEVYMLAGLGKCFVSKIEK